MNTEWAGSGDFILTQFPSRMAYVFWAPSLKHTTPTNGVHSLQLTCHGLKPIINWGLPESREQEPPECTTIQKPNQWKLTQSQLHIPEMAYPHRNDSNSSCIQDFFFFKIRATTMLISLWKMHPQECGVIAVIRRKDGNQQNEHYLMYYFLITWTGSDNNW